jgi:membrane associated rhomboid family serine protease
MRYQFQSNQGNFSTRPSIFPDAIKVLVSINFGIFILQTISKAENLFFPLFGLVPRLVWSELMVWQPFTYLFLHGGIWHVLINMFVLWMFGSELERVWGKNKFYKFYFITGVGSGVVSIIFGLNSMVPIVGASGAVYGVLLAYGFTYPNRTIYLYGIIPIKSRWFVFGIGIIAFFSSFNNISQISHITHISGMIIGYIALKKPIQLRSFLFSIRKKTIEYKIKKESELKVKENDIKRDVDFILDKINRKGFNSLSKNEQERLYKGSQSLSKNKRKD